jgi:hypothetical protein
MLPRPGWGQGWRKGDDLIFETGFLQSRFFLSADALIGLSTGFF